MEIWGSFGLQITSQQWISGLRTLAAHGIFSFHTMICMFLNVCNFTGGGDDDSQLSSCSDKIYHTRANLGIKLLAFMGLHVVKSKLTYRDPYRAFKLSDIFKEWFWEFHSPSEFQALFSRVLVHHSIHCLSYVVHRSKYHKVQNNCSEYWWSNWFYCLIQRHLEDAVL